MFLIRVCTCSDEINGDSQFISIAREGTAKESAIFKIVAPLFSEKTAFISAFPSWLLLHASRVARAFVLSQNLIFRNSQFYISLLSLIFLIIEDDESSLCIGTKRFLLLLFSNFSFFLVYCFVSIVRRFHIYIRLQNLYLFYYSMFQRRKFHPALKRI